MVKSLQLLSIVVPSLSMKSDSPQVLLQMGSSHKGGGVVSTQHSQHLHNGVQSMTTRMESMIEQAIANGGTPDLGNYLEEDAYQVMTAAIEQIEELLKAEKTQNDKDWKAAVEAVVQVLFVTAEVVAEVVAEMAVVVAEEAAVVMAAAGYRAG